MPRILALVVLTALTVPAATSGSELEPLSAQRKAPLVSARGAGKVDLGDKAGVLRNRNLIGPLHSGCPLEPGQRVASLKRPLVGFAVFGPNSDRVRSVTVTGGTAYTAKGVRIGSSPGHVLHAYPYAEYEVPGTNPQFDVGFIWVDNRENPRMTFTVDPGLRVSELSVPSPSICE